MKWFHVNQINFFLMSTSCPHVNMRSSRFPATSGESCARVFLVSSVLLLHCHVCGPCDTLFPRELLLLTRASRVTVSTSTTSSCVTSSLIQLLVLHEVLVQVLQIQCTSVCILSVQSTKLMSQCFVYVETK